MSAHELEEIRFSLLNLATLRESCAEAVGYTPSARTLGSAFDEVVAHLRNQGHDLAYLCGNCRAPIDGHMDRCWACGAVIHDEDDEEDIELAELRYRARGLKIDPSLPRAELAEHIQAAENRRRARNVDLAGIEATRLNERVAALIPAGWSTKRCRTYTSYWDHAGRCRFRVYDRGLHVQFSIEDGLLDDLPDVEHYDRAERRRRHFGAANYAYKGDVAKVAEELCRQVTEHYQAERSTSDED